MQAKTLTEAIWIARVEETLSDCGILTGILTLNSFRASSCSRSVVNVVRGEIMGSLLRTMTGLRHAADEGFPSSSMSLCTVCSNGVPALFGFPPLTTVKW